MILTERKPVEEVLAALEDDRRVLILRCGGCPEGADISSEAVSQTASVLHESGRTVYGPIAIDFLCHKPLILSRLQAPGNSWQVEKADRVLVFSCGLGVQATASALMKPVAPALNTRDLGGLRGKFPSVERCRECGDCLLHLTGGICPVAMCSKSLVNGTCGGTKDGKCEVSREKDCGWYLIYQRLKSLGRLDDLRKPVPPRNHALGDIPDAKRRTIWWGLDVVEAPPAPPAAEGAGKKKARKKAAKSE